MKNVEYDIPVFESNDLADLDLYSEKMATAIKEQIDKFGNPLAFKGIKQNISELDLISNPQSGDIYGVIETNKNYIWNGKEWIIYSDIMELDNYYNKEEINQKIGNIQALPVGGTKGQVLTKQSETNGDANWEDIEANEVFVGAEEPTTGEKVWFRKGKNLFDKSKALLGYWISNEQGDIAKADNDVFITDFIPVFKDVDVYIPATGSARREFYNKNKEGITYLNNSSVQVFTPTEDGFIRVTCVTSTVTMDNLMIYYGSKATSYEAYIEPKIYVRNSNGVYEEFAKKSEGLVDYTSYIEFNDKVTKIYNCTAYKKDNILFLNIDLGGNFPEGETVIGTIKRKLKLTAFGSGRLKTTNNKIIPATYIGLSEGAFRVHTTTTGTATTGNIILALEE